MNIRLNFLDLKEAINDYIRKKGVNAKVIQVSYTDRDGGHAQADYAVVLFEKDDESVITEVTNAKLHEYYEDLYIVASNEDPGKRQYKAECKAEAVIETLELLGITVKGVNA